MVRRGLSPWHSPGVDIWADIVASIALVIGVANSWRLRSRTTLSGTNSVHSFGGPDGRIAEYSTVLVTVRHIGKPITLESLGFELVERPPISTAYARRDLPVEGEFGAEPWDVQRPVLLQDGETRRFSLGRTFLHPAVARPGQDVRARVSGRLSSGKNIRSEPFEVRASWPDPEPWL